MNDRYYDSVLRFQNRVMVFVGVTNCFRKEFFVMLEFCFHLLSFFGSQMTYCPLSKITLMLRRYY